MRRERVPRASACVANVSGPWQPAVDLGGRAEISARVCARGYTWHASQVRHRDTLIIRGRFVRRSIETFLGEEGSGMAATNTKPHLKGILDSVVDFGPDDTHAALSHHAMESEAQRRIRNIVKEMEALNRRIDNLLK